MIPLYGIPSCDTVKKSRAWLDGHQMAYQFHDFKKQGVPSDALAQWATALGWESLVNKKGTTWRKLDTAEQSAVVDAASAVALMQLHASVIKRPVVVNSAVNAGGQTTVGYCPEAWASWSAMPAKA